MIFISYVFFIIILISFRIYNFLYLIVIHNLLIYFFKASFYIHKYVIVPPLLLFDLFQYLQIIYLIFSIFIIFVLTFSNNYYY